MVVLPARCRLPVDYRCLNTLRVESHPVLVPQIAAIVVLTLHIISSRVTPLTHLA